MLPHQTFNGRKMPFREIFESPLAFRHGFIDGFERFDDGQEMLIIIGEFEFDRPEMREISGDRRRRFGVVAVTVHQRLKTEALQALSDGAAVPSQDVCRGLHVKILSPEALEHGLVTGGSGKDGGFGLPSLVRGDRFVERERMLGQDVSVRERGRSL